MVMKNRFSKPLLFTFLVSCVRIAAGQNAIVNPDFDSSLSGWKNDKPSQYTCRWEDENGYPDLGSALCAVPPFIFQAGIHQCLAVTSERVDFTAYVDGTFAGAVFVSFHSTAGCTDTESQQYALTDEGLVDSSKSSYWHSFALRFIPIDAPYVLIDLVSTGQAIFDHVYVGPSETIFIDRFECDKQTQLDCR